MGKPMRWVMGLNSARHVSLVLSLLAATAGCRHSSGQTIDGAAAPLAALNSAQETFLDDLERRSFLFFWEHANPQNGLIADRAKADGAPGAAIASIASTGFGLTAMCIADSRGWITHEEAR